MDSSASSSAAAGWLIYMLPLLAQPGGSSSLSITGLASTFWMPMAILLSIFAVSATVAWCFPGGPAWGSKILLSSKNSLFGARSIIPGPRGMPIVGSLLQMGGLAHRRLETLASKFNARRLMALSLGSTRLIVTSNAEVAREILGAAAFADRPLKQSAQQLLFGRAIGFAPYGDYWRRLRRIAAGCLFSPRRIAAHEQRRQQDTTLMLEEIRRRSSSNLVQVRGLLQRASLSSIMGSVFGRKFEGAEEQELQSMVREGFELLGAFNFADHLPSLRDFDPQGVVQRCAALVPRVNAFVQRIIDEHRTKTTTKANAVPGDCGDFVDVLLALQGEDKLEDSDMIAVLWEMIFRGTDTTAILTEWVLAELVLNPEIQRKLQAEIDAVCATGAFVRDCDVERMPFLQAVVNETLRMHPPGPLLSWARLATQDVEVSGYHVPAGTTAMVNMWAITHDASVWSEPLRFKPERFMEGEFKHFDVRGNDLRLAPFGAGRRVCPGRALGLATVRLWVARLVQDFTWEAGSNGVDLNELLKLSCEMATPLSARAIPRRNLLLASAA